MELAGLPVAHLRMRPPLLRAGGVFENGPGPAAAILAGVDRFITVNTRKHWRPDLLGPDQDLARSRRFLICAISFNRQTFTLKSFVTVQSSPIGERAVAARFRQ